MLIALVLAGCSAETGAHRPLEDAATTDVSTTDADTSVADADDAAIRRDGSDAADTAPDANVAVEQPRCTVEADAIRCAHNTTIFDTGFGDYEDREVHWQVPTGQPPVEGWPTVILFQGSFYSSERYWEGESGDAMGLFHRVRTLQNLLESGFAVITPEAHYNGSTYWDTNLPAWAYNWSNAPDHHLMLDIFEAIELGEFGKLDPVRLYAGGISSGGYMTSRMAEAYPGKFRALAIMSASYCRCGGYNCYVPSNLPADHPPTLFIHGRADYTVPVWTMTPYEEGLRDDGVDTRLLIEESAGHHWIEQAPQAILDWFQLY